MDNRTEYCVVPTPIGPVRLQSADGVLTACRIGAEDELCPPETPLLTEAARQLSEYFAGTRREFDLPLDPRDGSTPFRRRVWDALRGIPCGATASYAGLASRIGSPRACRAVAGACHANPLPIFIPCHRVVGSDGSLTGYACGLGVKKFLLDLESRAGCQ